MKDQILIFWKKIVSEYIDDIQRIEQEKDKDKKYIVRESSASFYRSIRLPEAADEDSIKAKMKDGVLRVSIQFKELPKPKQIALEA